MSMLADLTEVRTYWSADEQRVMAADMKLDMTRCTLSDYVSMPGTSRAAMMASLRMLAAIPGDDGQA